MNIRQTNINGIETTLQIDRTQLDLEVHIGYNFPKNLSAKYDGLVHFLEHVVFGDILPNTTSLKLYEIANRNGVSFNGATSILKMYFTFKVETLITPKFKSVINQFDTSSNGVALLKQLVAGVVKPHQFNTVQINKEKGIIRDELNKTLSTIEGRIVNTTESIYFNRTVIGESAEVINNVTLEDIQEIANNLPVPSITVTYNDNIPAFSNIEQILREALASYSPYSFGNNLQLAEISANLISDKMFRQNLVDVYKPKFLDTDLNSLLFSIFLDKQDAKKDALNFTLALEYLTSSSSELSLTSLIREKLSCSYGLSTCKEYIMVPETEKTLLSFSFSIDKASYNLTNYIELEELVNTIDRNIVNMPLPTREQYADILSSYFSYMKDSINTQAIDQDVLYSYLSVGFSVPDIVDIINCNTDISYQTFVEYFDRMKNSIKIIIL